MQQRYKTKKVTIKEYYTFSNKAGWSEARLASSLLGICRCCRGVRTSFWTVNSLNLQREKKNEITLIIITKIVHDNVRSKIIEKTC